jgi:hypothetical protein
MSTGALLKEWRSIAGRLNVAWGRWQWEPFGPDGIVGLRPGHSVIVTRAEHDGAEWIHASLAHETRVPSYGQLVALHHAVWGDEGFAYQVFASSARHVSIHPNALHLWGRADGANVLPDFGGAGTI